MSTQSPVLSISVLKRRIHEGKALQLLKQIVTLTKPLLQRHGWILPQLGEMYPTNPCLLGLNYNRGKKILLRLRSPHDVQVFLSLEEVTYTFLHELTHNVYGPHDDKFYKYLAELVTEYEGVLASGWKGEGFDSPGQRLGKGHDPDVKSSQRKLKAAAMAEARQANNQGAGFRLGGVANPNMSRRDLMAQAAQRRMHDEKTCGETVGVDDILTSVDQEDRVIDLTKDDSDCDKLLDDQRGSACSPILIEDDDDLVILDVPPTGIFRKA